MGRHKHTPDICRPCDNHKHGCCAVHRKGERTQDEKTAGSGLCLRRTAWYRMDYSGGISETWRQRDTIGAGQEFLPKIAKVPHGLSVGHRLPTIFIASTVVCVSALLHICELCVVAALHGTDCWCVCIRCWLQRFSDFRGAHQASRGKPAQGGIGHRLGPASISGCWCYSLRLLYNGTSSRVLCAMSRIGARRPPPEALLERTALTRHDDPLHFARRDVGSVLR